MASEQLTPQEQARRLRHAAVTERASNLLRNDQTKLADFRQRISSFRNGTITAPSLIDTFFALFDTTSNELGKLVKEIAEIFSDLQKREVRDVWLSNEGRPVHSEGPVLSPKERAASSTD